MKDVLRPESTPGMSPTPASSAIQAETVSFCDLVSNPTLYDKKIVRTTALFALGTEFSSCFSKDCDIPDNHIRWEFENLDVRNGLMPYLELDKIGLAVARATVVGRLESPDERDYGHPNGSRYKFVIIAVEKAEKLNPETVWPGRIKY